MSKVLFLLTINFFAIGLSQIGDENELLVIRQMVGIISESSCIELSKGVNDFCCDSQPILSVFERMMGLKSVSLCQIHQMVCSNSHCESFQRMGCSATQCSELSEEDMKLEELILNHEISDQDVLQTILPDLLEVVQNDHDKVPDIGESSEANNKIKTLRLVILALKNRKSRLENN